MSAVVVWAGIAAFRVLEIPDHYSRTPTNQYLRDREELTESGPTLAEVQSLASNEATKAFLTLAIQLTEEALPTFYPIDTAPRSWTQLDDRTRNWAMRHLDKVPRIRDLIGAGHGLSFAEVSDENQALRSALLAWNGDGFAFLVSMSHFEDIGVEQHNHILCYGQHYLPLILLELHGARLHDQGEYQEAMKLYSTAVRGYWCMVRSPQPGRDHDPRLRGCGTGLSSHGTMRL